MARTKLIFMIAFIVMAIIVICYLNSFNKDTEEKFTEDESFEKLIQYKTESVSDNINIDNILKNTELSQYISRVEKKSEVGNEQLIIYYDCTIEAEVKEYWKNANKNSVTEKISVILFSLIDKLDRIKYEFNVSDKELVENYQYLSEGITKEYDRESINLKYNQDVRNYKNNPCEFLKYNIDMNATQITVYQLEYSTGNREFKKIEINDKEKLEKIKEMIESGNFGIVDNPTESMIEILLDLHNGYVIAMFADNSNNGEIFKGTVEEYFDEGYNSEKCVSKTLPNGLKEYIYDIINAE